MVTPAQIIDEARAWIGTPYAHQGRELHVAVDCIGLVFGVMRNLALGDEVFWERVERRWGVYKRIPDGHTLHDAFSLFLPEYPRHRAQPGDMLLIRFAGAPRHTAILTEQNTIIHAYSNVKRCVENRWAGPWKNDTTGAFRIREFDFEKIKHVEF